MAQPGKGIADGGEEQRRSIAILDASLMHDRTNQKAGRISQDVAFAALDLLAGIIAARPAGFGGLDRLAVDDAGGGARFAPRGFTRQHQQDMVDLTPQTAIAPGVEVMLNRGVGREILGQQAPLAAALRQIEDRVHHRTQRRRARAAATLVRRGQERLDHGQLGIGCIACIAQPVASILRASDFGPHLVPPSCLATTTESQAAEITQPIFGAASETINGSSLLIAFSVVCDRIFWDWKSLFRRTINESKIYLAMR